MRIKMNKDPLNVLFSVTSYHNVHALMQKNQNFTNF